MENLIDGVLEPFFETGTEGILWAVYQDGDKGYSGLHILKDGDYLTIFSHDCHIQWEGIISFNHKTRYRPYPYNPQYGQQEVLGYWVHGLQDNLEPEVWAQMFFDGLKVKLRKKNA